MLFLECNTMLLLMPKPPKNIWWIKKRKRKKELLTKRIVVYESDKRDTYPQFLLVKIKETLLLL